ncbi:hypothetical protein ATY41_09145 [Leifsonia xyli subsp. xyli]|uniref:Uncharacterized protein n=1 Tax=Leifsonia xyli subsp. xyli TaxID=59736 RepID=A0A1E2SM54_LEIXY|nr:hypothetical protein [Leifsonia xyli]ODA90688.1 hypothetical protein ATY41_09145 [Leifsonia xyli subsp. xyli]
MGRAGPGEPPWGPLAFAAGVLVPVGETGAVLVWGIACVLTAGTAGAAAVWSGQGGRGGTGGDVALGPVLLGAFWAVAAMW